MSAKGPWCMEIGDRSTQRARRQPWWFKEKLLHISILYSITFISLMTLVLATRGQCSWPKRTSSQTPQINAAWCYLIKMREGKASMCLSTVPSGIIFYQSTEKAPWPREQGPIQEALFPQTPGITDSFRNWRKGSERCGKCHAGSCTCPSQLRSLRLESQEGRG